MKRLIFLCFVLHFGGLVSADYIPVIIWGPNVQHESAVALKSHCGYEFIDILKKSLTVDTITFIAAEDQLSVEDLSHCKAPSGQSCFKGIQSIATKLYLPQVEDPAYVIEDAALEAADDLFEINLQSSGNVNESLQNRTGNYVFVRFGDDNYTNETIPEKLTRHDHMITKFYKEFLSQSEHQIVVVFTGKGNANHVRSLREISLPPSTYFEAHNSTDSINSTVRYVFKSESVLLHYTSIGMQISNESLAMNVTKIEVVAVNVINRNVEEGPSGTTVSTPNNETIIHTANRLIVTMSMNINDTFVFVITTNRGYWWAHQFAWNDCPLSSNTPISAANNFSYHCSPITLTHPKGNKTCQIGNEIDQNGIKIVVTWKDLQLQPKFLYAEGQKIESFNDAYDCVGFVCPGILSGIFVCFLLIFVLFIGILCIMDIKPNDRFEDPKGPRMTFTVIE